LLEKYQKEIIDEISYKEKFDFPVKKYYEKLGFDFNFDSFEKIGVEFIEHYNTMWQKCTLQNGSIELIKQLNMAGYTQFVLSAREKSQLLRELEHFGISGYMKKIVGIENNYANGKLDVAKEFFKEFKLQKKETLLVGDTLHDLEVANTLGIKCILFSGGHFSLQRLEQSNNTLIHRLEEVMQHVH
jgi:phosphoglycolate phosphatase